MKFDESIESSIYENTVDPGHTEDQSPKNKGQNIVIQKKSEEPAQLPFAKSIPKKKEGKSKAQPPSVPAQPYYKMVASTSAGSK